MKNTFSLPTSHLFLTCTKEGPIAEKDDKHSCGTIKIKLTKKETMKKLFYTLAAAACLLTTTADVQAQSIMRALERAKNSVENVTRNEDKREERRQAEEERTNPASVEKASFHEANIGKILFSTGRANPNLEDESAFVTTLNLSQPSFFNVYLEDPMYAIVARRRNLGEYDFVSPAFIRKYYINDELIVSYIDQISSDDFRNSAIHSDVLVPADYGAFENNEMRVGVLAHVFSALSPGTHKFKVEYVMIISNETENTTGSAAKVYDNQELVVASGEVDLQADAQSVNAYAKQYGRPKFTKGVLDGQAKLEQQLTQLIKNDSKRDVVYMYASDNWKIIRGAFDRITGREARIYYVFTNDKGRCELSDFVVHQAYEGNGYGAPTFGYSTFAPAFKYVVCQNY